MYSRFQNSNHDGLPFEPFLGEPANGQLLLEDRDSICGCYFKLRSGLQTDAKMHTVTNRTESIKCLLVRKFLT